MRRRLFAVGIAVLAALFVAVGITGTSIGIGGPQTAVAADPPPLAFEDYAYPNAAQIKTEQGILLKKGDGHITLVDCASETGLIEVWSRSNDKFCFKVTGDSGWLTLELPSVYGVKGNDYAVEVDMTVENTKKTYNIARNSWTQVGETADPEGRPHTLVEIRAVM
ncbi:hypothetical protein [Streptomyces sp. NPDC002851]